MSSRPSCCAAVEGMAAHGCQLYVVNHAPDNAGVVYGKAGLGGRAELAAFFLQDLMLPEEEREVLHAGAAATSGQ